MPMEEAGRPRFSWFLAQVVVLTAMSSILSGYDQGVIAGAMVTMKIDINLSEAEQEQSIGILNLAAAVGGVCTGYVADSVGRRWTITLANLLFMFGSLLLAVCNGFAVLMFGRIVMGLGVGIALVIAPLFTAELVPASMRGGLVGLADVSTNLGILLGYMAGVALWGVDAGWRIMFGLGIVPALFLAVLIWTVPDSVRWLLMKGRDEEARAALEKTAVFASCDPVAQQAVVDEELETIRDAIRGKDGNTEDAGTWREVFFPSSRIIARMLRAGLGIAFFSQACGTEAVVYYVPDVMEDIGLEGKATLWAAAVAGLCKVVFLLVGVCLFDRVGRRPMLMVSAAGLSVSFCLVSLSYAVEAQWLSIVGICASMSSFSLGFSPLVYVVGTEVFPNHLRAKAMALALCITRVLAGIVSISFLSLTNLLGAPVLWACFALIAGSALLFVWCCVPETKGLTLEQVISRFQRDSDERRDLAMLLHSADQGERDGEASQPLAQGCTTPSPSQQPQQDT